MEKEISNISINYEKESKKNTVLIRLHIKSKRKRKKLFDFFSSTINSFDIEYFKEHFNSFVKSKTHDVEWCKFKWKDDDSWNIVYSEKLSNSISDVIDIDDFLILAFNLDKISKDSTTKLDDFIWYIFKVLDGVKKVWVKYRLKNGKEQYLYFPGMGDESFFVDKKISNDNDWPKL